MDCLEVLGSTDLRSWVTVVGDSPGHFEVEDVFFYVDDCGRLSLEAFLLTTVRSPHLTRQSTSWHDGDRATLDIFRACPL